jgi:peptide deformylase
VLPIGRFYRDSERWRERKGNDCFCRGRKTGRARDTLTLRRLPLTSPPMALRDIITLPDKRLRLVSKPVGKIDADVRRLVEDMFETMYEAPGIGLAAIQLGVPKRIITMDLAKKDEPKNPQVFINPEILWTSEERATYEEGCLSIPEYYEEVERPAQVKVAYLDGAGARQEIEANGLFATCLQHEIDHLDGVLFIDYISKLKRSRVIKKFAKAAKRADADA